MPVTELLDAVEVLEELPQQPRLARPASPTTVTCSARRSRGALSPASMIARSSAIASDERRLEPAAAARAAGAGDHAQRRPRMDGLLAALDLMDARVLVGDRRLGGAAGDVIDEHGAGCRDRLQPRRRVDGVAQHHALASAPSSTAACR